MRGRRWNESEKGKVLVLLAKTKGSMDYNVKRV